MANYTYPWQIKIGPLLVRPDTWDPTHREIINYYWCGRYLLTSARRYITLNLRSTVLTVYCWPEHRRWGIERQSNEGYTGV